MGISVGQDYPVQQARLRSLLIEYHDIGPVGNFGFAQIEATLKRADVAAMSQDLTQIMRCYLEMREMK